jgi:hypothetical protein
MVDYMNAMICEICGEQYWLDGPPHKCLNRREELEKKFNRATYKMREEDRLMREEHLAALKRLEEEEAERKLRYYDMMKKWDDLTFQWSDFDRQQMWDFIAGHMVAIG